jgi:hypothetical protein
VPSAIPSVIGCGVPLTLRTGTRLQSAQISLGFSSDVPEDYGYRPQHRLPIIKQSREQMAAPHYLLSMMGITAWEGYLQLWYTRMFAFFASALLTSDLPLCRLREKLGKKLPEICMRMR